jgi:1-acyl-sn-glycerol-3-phosphate acyltransferase
MRHLRAIARIILLACAMLGFYTLWVVGLPFVYLFPRAWRRWRGFCFCGWARASARICGMKKTVRGAPPRGAFFLVSNHLGYIDVITLASLADCVFVAKSDVAGWPVVGFICRTVGIVFIDRARKRSIPEAMEKIERRMRQGLGVVLFPEGTSTSGERVAAFKPSLLELAATARVPVHYASLSYRTPPGEPTAREAVCWWGDMTFGGHVYRLLQLPRFDATVVFGERPVSANDRKALAEKLHDAVSAQHIPVV